MNLPNVFGMHLGCKVRVPRFDTNEDYFLHSVQRRGWVIVSFSVEYREAKIEDCKLILKPLSAITEEDKRQFIKRFNLKDLKCFNLKLREKQGTKRVCLDYLPESSNGWFSSEIEYSDLIWLCSKGYDIGIVPEENKILEGE